jgi:hypothetical protein
VDIRKLYCHLLRGDWMVEVEQDFGDRSERIRIETDTTPLWVAELQKQILCLLCLLLSIYLSFLLKIVLA